MSAMSEAIQQEENIAYLCAPLAAQIAEEVVRVRESTAHTPTAELPLDAAVHREVLQRPDPDPCGSWDLQTGQAGARMWWPQYSLVAPLAWEVLEHVKSLGYHLNLYVREEWFFCSIWRADFHGQHVVARAATMPMAVCRAALEAVREQKRR